MTRLAGEQAVADAVASGTAEQIAAAQSLAAAASQAAAAELTAKQTVLSAVLGGSPHIAPTAEEIAAALAEVSVARAQAEATRLAGEQAVAEAAAGVRASLAGARPSPEPVRAAAAALDDARSAVRVIGARVARLAEDLARAQRRAGVQLPADEVIFVPAAPVRVVERPVARGALAQQVVLAVADAAVVVDGALALAEARLVAPGMRVRIDEPDLGLAAEGIVRRVAEAPGTDGVDGFHVYFEIAVEGAPPALVGASVRLTVPIESSAGSVLAVPVSAVSLAADGSSRVQRDAGGTLEFVTVAPGLSVDGFVGVTPMGGDLEPGDLVVVGFDAASSVAAP